MSIQRTTPFVWQIGIVCFSTICSNFPKYTFITLLSLLFSVQELDRWYAEIRLCLDHLLQEMNSLRYEKSLMESALDALSIRLSVATECLSMRDNRLHGELTQDNANIELKNELATVECSVNMLSDHCQRAWEQLDRLKEVKMKLNLELMHKNEARDCDNQQQITNEMCSNVTHKTDPMRNPRK